MSRQARETNTTESFMLSASLDIPEFRRRGETILDHLQRSTKKEGRNLHPAMALRKYLEEGTRAAYDVLMEDVERRHSFRIYTTRDELDYDDEGVALYLPSEPDGVDSLQLQEGKCNATGIIATGEAFPSAAQYREFMELEGVAVSVKASLTRAMRQAQVHGYYGVLEYLINEIIPLPDASHALSELATLTYDEDTHTYLTFTTRIISLHRRAYGEALLVNEENVSAVTRVIHALEEKAPNFPSLDNGGQYAISVTDAPAIGSLRELLNRLKYHSEKQANKRNRDQGNIDKAQTHLGFEFSPQQRRIFLQTANSQNYTAAMKKFTSYLKSQRPKKQRTEDRVSTTGSILLANGQKFLPYKTNEEMGALGLDARRYLRARGEEKERRISAIRQQGKRPLYHSDAEIQRRFKKSDLPEEQPRPIADDVSGRSSSLFTITLEKESLEILTVRLGELDATISRVKGVPHLPAGLTFANSAKVPRPFVLLGFGGRTERCLVDSGCTLPAAIAKEKVNRIYRENRELVGSVERFSKKQHLPLVGLNGTGAAKVVGMVELLHTVKVKKGADVPFICKYAVIAGCPIDLPVVWGLPTITRENLVFGQSHRGFHVATVPDACAPTRSGPGQVSGPQRKSESPGTRTLQDTSGIQEKESNVPSAADVSARKSPAEPKE